MILAHAHAEPSSQHYLLLLPSSLCYFPDELHRSEALWYWKACIQNKDKRSTGKQTKKILKYTINWEEQEGQNIRAYFLYISMSYDTDLTRIMGQEKRVNECWRELCKKQWTDAISHFTTPRITVA